MLLPDSLSINVGIHGLLRLFHQSGLLADLLSSKWHCLVKCTFLCIYIGICFRAKEGMNRRILLSFLILSVMGLRYDT